MYCGALCVSRRIKAVKITDITCRDVHFNPEERGNKFFRNISEFHHCRVLWSTEISARNRQVIHGHFDNSGIIALN
jgi:hypothetical protein